MAESLAQSHSAWSPSSAFKLQWQQISSYITFLRTRLIFTGKASLHARHTLQQNVFLVTKISEEIFFVTKNTALVTKYEFRH